MHPSRCFAPAIKQIEPSHDRTPLSKPSMTPKNWLLPMLKATISPIWLNMCSVWTFVLGSSKRCSLINLLCADSELQTSLLTPKVWHLFSLLESAPLQRGSSNSDGQVRSKLRSDPIHQIFQTHTKLGLLSPVCTNSLLKCLQAVSTRDKTTITTYSRWYKTWLIFHGLNYNNYWTCLFTKKGCKRDQQSCYLKVFMRWCFFKWVRYLSFQITVSTKFLWDLDLILFSKNVLVIMI